MSLITLNEIYSFHLTNWVSIQADAAAAVTAGLNDLLNNFATYNNTNAALQQLAVLASVGGGNTSGIYATAAVSGLLVTAFFSVMQASTN